MSDYPNDQSKPAGAIPVYWANAPVPTYRPLTGSYQQITVATATALTPPADAVLAVIVAENGNVRYRDDGTDPTASVGMPLYAGSPLIYTGPLNAIRFIAMAVTSPLTQIDVLYYGQ